MVPAVCQSTTQGWLLLLYFVDFCCLQVSIIPRGKGLGYALYQPEEKYLYTAAALQDIMAMSLGGRAAELIFFGDFSTGAQDDLAKVTESAYSQVLLYGMSETVGHVSFTESNSHGQRLYGEQTASLVDTEVRTAIQQTMDRVLTLLKEKKHLVEALAERLLVQEVLEREDMLEVLGPRPWAEKTSYDDFVAGTGSTEEDNTLPEGLKDWNKEVEEVVKVVEPEGGEDVKGAAEAKDEAGEVGGDRTVVDTVDQKDAALDNLNEIGDVAGHESL